MYKFLLPLNRSDNSFLFFMWIPELQLEGFKSNTRALRVQFLCWLSLPSLHKQHIPLMMMLVVVLKILLGKGVYKGGGLGSWNSPMGPVLHRATFVDLPWFYNWMHFNINVCIYFRFLRGTNTLKYARVKFLQHSPSPVHSFHSITCILSLMCLLSFQYLYIVLITYLNFFLLNHLIT